MKIPNIKLEGMSNFWYTLFAFLFTFKKYLSAISPYQSVVDTVFKQYNPGFRPVKNLNETITVEIKFGIIQLLKVEEVGKTVECVCFMEMIWRDDFLQWDPESHNNVTSFRYPHQKIWKPDIILTNTPDLNQGPIAELASTNVVINYDGVVTNSFTAVYKVTCRWMDVTQFPFDQHYCDLDFASWTYSGSEVDIVDRSSTYEVPESMKFINHSGWDLKMLNTEKLIEADCCPNETYPTLRFKIFLKRRPLYFLINIIIPTTITCYISFVGMFSPSSNTGERMEKAFLGITTLLAVSLLMLTVSAQMPVTSNAVPLMGYFLGVYILTIAFAIICTSIIMRIDCKGLDGEPVPKWARLWIIQRMGRLLCVYKSGMTKTARTQKPKETITPDNNKDLPFPISQALDVHLEKWLDILAESQTEKDRLESIKNEWSQLSIVLDRLCLIIFLTWSSVFTISVLYRQF